MCLSWPLNVPYSFPLSIHYLYCGRSWEQCHQNRFVFLPIFHDSLWGQAGTLTSSGPCASDGLLWLEIKFFHHSWFYIVPLEKILMLYSLFCTWNCQLLKIIPNKPKKKNNPSHKHFLNEISQRSVFFLNQLKYFNLIMLKFLPSEQ